MRLKLRVVDVEEACECPFYMKDTNGSSHCLVKLTTTPQILTSLLENSDHSDEDYWEMDCEGKWNNCSVLPLIYKFKEDEEAVVEAPIVSKSEQAIKEYDPFNDSEDPDDYPDEPEAPVITPGPDKITDKVFEMEQYTTQVSLHVVKNPYIVKGDVLIYPTNNQLYIDDLTLRRMLRSTIDSELEAYLQRPIQMGHIYATTNGGDKSHVKAKKIYHAVVAGTSRLVNEQDVGNTTFKGLNRASSEGAESVVMLPGDCGTLDIYATALVQMGAIKQFLLSHPDTSIKHIFIVMTDELSHGVFSQYYKRVFKKRKVAVKQPVAHTV